MLTYAQLLAALPALGIVALTPGPNNLLSFRNAMKFGILASFTALIGRMTAYACMLALVVAGLSLILQESRLIFTVIKVLGGLYLIWLGIQALRGRDSYEPQEQAREVAAPHQWRLIRREFLVAISNPKALLVFSAVLPQFVRVGDAEAVQLIELGLVFMVAEIAAALFWILCGNWLGLRAGAGDWIGRIDRATGALFVGLGITLLALKPHEAT
ncbi:LysE family translocator [soil metagenome]